MKYKNETERYLDSIYDDIDICLDCPYNVKGEYCYSIYSNLVEEIDNLASENAYCPQGKITRDLAKKLIVSVCRAYGKRAMLNLDKKECTSKTISLEVDCRLVSEDTVRLSELSKQSIALDGFFNSFLKEYFLLFTNDERSQYIKTLAEKAGCVDEARKMIEILQSELIPDINHVKKIVYSMKNPKRLYPTEINQNSLEATRNFKAYTDHTYKNISKYKTPILRVLEVLFPQIPQNELAKAIGK